MANSTAEEALSNRATKPSPVVATSSPSYSLHSRRMSAKHCCMNSRVSASCSLTRRLYCARSANRMALRDARCASTPTAPRPANIRESQWRISETELLGYCQSWAPVRLLNLLVGRSYVPVRCAAVSRYPCRSQAPCYDPCRALPLLAQLRDSTGLQPRSSCLGGRRWPRRSRLQRVPAFIAASRITAATLAGSDSIGKWLVG